MSAPLKKHSQAINKVVSSKPSRVVKMDDEVINKITLPQARKQAKKIMKALEEADQIRSGKLKATTFEEYFGTI